MSFLQEKLFDLLINFISIVAGGGLVFLIIEWRRHSRERKQWQQEDQMIQVDLPRAEMVVYRWEPDESMADKAQLVLYKKNLIGQVNEIIIIAEFVIRNTTSAEIILTDYVAKPLGVTSSREQTHYYDLEHFDPVSVDEIGAIRLNPYGNVPRYCIIRLRAESGSKIEQIPSTLAVEVTTSSGKVVQNKISLKTVEYFGEIQLHEYRYYPKKHLEKIGVATEDDIPF